MMSKLVVVVASNIEKDYELCRCHNVDHKCKKDIHLPEWVGEVKFVSLPGACVNHETKSFVIFSLYFNMESDYFWTFLFLFCICLVIL